MNILVIDDDASIQYMLSEICEFAGWNVDTANNGKEGLNVFAEKGADVVLVDYHMPEMDGIKTVGELRNLNADVPILVLTVDERQEIADRFLEAGATDFALKPVKAPDLISRIQLHARLAKLTQSATQQKSSEEKDVFVTKGISKSTLCHVSDFLNSNREPFSVDTISKEVGLAYPTVYRYIMHLLDEGKVEIIVSYQKIGRPKNLYQWIVE
ncbi:response regulator [Bacillus sp. ISL-4]|uniref:response regulator n=1 Tax=Bacillus sp. ISL-4 TaxID=2819125 RepID=UPI001BEBD195|nr:response regulator [Bacillus sp. ISL-4]MBT2668100.1 response regulator [Bacillus sp. ISL-4]MBT2673656.1 response regulator [Streptomyces sp. ISL-14]